ncbi:hypothetical protein [Aeromonas sp. QDB14]|uniref:hypothetical protein n=1 Tax=Aeromonas sp. QDB14 TaxID=2989836 RepID=UPI0022E40BD3|nr:hypothetical protein [Aeromonas sp. QDB14]
MNNIALLIAEAPWFPPKENHSQASCTSYFHGVKSIVNGRLNEGQLNIYDCSFYDAKSLEYAVQHLVNTSENRQIMYLGAHGDGNRIAKASLKKVSETIKTNGKNIKGLIISSCWAAKSNTLEESMGWSYNIGERAAINENYGPNWVFSYKVPVSWFFSAMIETSIVKVFSEIYIRNPQQLNSKAGILSAFSEALGIFDHSAMLGFDDNFNYVIPLKDSIRIWVRAQGARNPQDATMEFFR